MRHRGLWGAGVLICGLTLVSPAFAGGQEEDDPTPTTRRDRSTTTLPDEDVEEPGTETPLPTRATTAPTITQPGGTTLPTLPPDCDPRPAAAVVFVGRLTAAAGGVARFQVEAVRADPDGRVAIGRLVDVTLGSDVRYLVLDDRYLVGAEDDGTGALRSKVHQPEALFGGDEVVGLNDADPDCPPFVDPISVRRADGGPVDTGVFGGFLDDRRSIALAVLVPAGAVFGVLVGLVMVKYLLIGIGRVTAWTFRRIRRRGGGASTPAPLASQGR
jgi:hypothetical protein